MGFDLTWDEGQSAFANGASIVGILNNSAPEASYFRASNGRWRTVFGESIACAVWPDGWATDSYAEDAEYVDTCGQGTRWSAEFVQLLHQRIQSGEIQFGDGSEGREASIARMTDVEFYGDQALSREAAAAAYDDESAYESGLIAEFREFVAGAAALNLGVRLD